MWPGAFASSITIYARQLALRNECYTWRGVGRAIRRRCYWILHQTCLWLCVCVYVCAHMRSCTCTCCWEEWSCLFIFFRIWKLQFPPRSFKEEQVLINLVYNWESLFIPSFPSFWCSPVDINGRFSTLIWFKLSGIHKSSYKVYWTSPHPPIPPRPIQRFGDLLSGGGVGAGGGLISNPQSLQFISPAERSSRLQKTIWKMF